MRVLMTMFLIGCGGGDLCDRLAKDAEECEDEITDEDMEECRESLESCSNDDQDKIESYFDCLEDEGIYLTCDDTTETGTKQDFKDFFAAFAACAPEIEGVSDECMGDFVETSTTTTTPT